MSKQTSELLVWMDLEMTGLDPDRETILEIATLITTADLDVVAEGPCLVIRQPRSILDAMDDWNREHHGASGLTERSLRSTTDLADAETQTLAFVGSHCAERASPLCGNSIHQDRRFLARYMPKLEAYFHYRNIDVSTVKELVQRWYPDGPKAPTKKHAHLALDDIRESIEELRFYRRSYFADAAMKRPVRLAVLLSGGGTTLQNLLDRIADGTLAADVSVVVGSRPDAYGLERARRGNVPALAIPRKEYPDSNRFNDAVHDALEPYSVDLVVLAGFLSLFQPRERYACRVLNIHPALIPAFCGSGFYGDKVHRAVIESGAKVSGCTVHFADDEYDHGPIILQKAVPVLEDDTPDSLAARVHEAENELYPEAIRLWAAGRLLVDGRRVRILPAVDQG